MTPTLHDLDIFARTLWGEARGEGWQGMQAVACVILNRQRDQRWPDRIADVCLQPWQFSCWNDSDVNLRKLRNVKYDEDKEFRECYAIAAMAMADMLTDRTSGANHYLASALFEDQKRRPKWAREEAVTCSFRNHVFLKL